MLPGHPSDFPRHSEEAQAAFLDRVLALARTAEARTGTILRDFVIAGIRFRFCFAGATLERALTPALAHRLSPPVGQGDVLLHIWDSASSGIAICPPPVGRHCFSERGDIWGFDSRRYRSAFDRTDASLSLLDLSRGEGAFWIEDGANVPPWTRASPLRTLFHWALGARGMQLVHGAAVGNEHGGVLITGRGGAGKSTSALSCVGAGFDYAGDDHVLLTGGAEPRAHSLYGTARMHRDSAAHFGRFDPDCSGPGPGQGPGKALIDLRRAPEGAGRIVDSLALRAVLTPVFGNAPDTRVEPAQAALLVGAATYSSLAQLPHAGQEMVDFLTDTLRRLPGYRLILGTAVNRVPVAIAALLAAGPRPAAPAADGAPAPLVSVVIPVHNGAHFIAEAVASILAQGHPALELIVVDDESTDLLDTAVAALPVPVRSIRIPRAGAAAARNVGAQAASGDLVAFLDVDDLWPDGALAAMLAHLDAHPETDVAIGRDQLFDDVRDGRHFVGSPAESFPFSIGAALFRRRAFETVGRFDAGLRYGEDIDWFVRAREAGLAVDRLDMVTLHVRRHGANMTAGRTALELLPLQIARNALHRRKAISAENRGNDA